MAQSALKVNGIGCGLGDIIYGSVSLTDPAISRYLAKRESDHGIQAGKLVFLDDLLAYSKSDLPELLESVTHGAAADAFNVGGPALVASVLAAQLLSPHGIQVSYHGRSGDDDISKQIRDILARTPLDLRHYERTQGRTPSTYVFSDPSLHDGQGDRSFVNDMGVCAEFTPRELSEDFFDATLILFGGTALVPGIHAALASLLAECRNRNILSLVGTVYDFVSEKRNPGAPWGLGNWESFRNIDLLVADREEILKVTGATDMERAIDRAFEAGLASLVVTQGPDPVLYRSRGGIFGRCEGNVQPSSAVKAKVRDRRQYPGDTTGAGDNFLGALAAHLMQQISTHPQMGKGETQVEREVILANPLKLEDALRFATAAGGLACLQFGGVCVESRPGQRLHEIESLAAE